MVWSFPGLFWDKTRGATRPYGGRVSLFTEGECVGYVGQPGITTAHLPHAVTNLAGCSASQVPPDRVALWPLHNDSIGPVWMPGRYVRKAHLDGRLLFIHGDP